MEVFDNPMFMISLLIGAAILAGISSAYQVYGPESEGHVKPKAVMRDGILGAIFTAMAWTLVPDSMKSVTESVTTSMTTVATSAVSVAPGLGDYDLQIGPARF
jgi:hypothetical protein